jgi:PAS domain S-box-containing protein
VAAHLAIAAGVAGLYFLAGRVGLTLASVHPYATPVWVPTGVALAALLVFGYRAWPGVLAGAFLVNLLIAGSVAVSSAIALGNTLEALLGAYLVNRFAGGRRAFDRPQSVFAFAALAALVSTTVSATVGVTSLALGGLAPWADYGSVWLTWWLGDAAGALLVTPVLILWIDHPSLRWNLRQWVEAVLFLLALVLTGLVVFYGLRWDDRLACLGVPLLMWAAFRFGQREVATALLVLSGLAVWATLRGSSPFVRASPNEPLLLLQVFMGLVAVPVLALAAAEGQRRHGEKALREEGERLHLAQEAGRTGAWEWDVPTGKVAWSRGLEAIHGLAPGAFPGTLAAVLDNVHPEDRGRVAGATARILEWRAEDRLEYRVLRPDGGVRWVEGRGRLVLDAAGKPACMRGVCLDVTERKRAERLLAAEHAVARALAGSATLLDAAPKILRAVCEGLDWDVGVCWRVDRPAGVLRCVEFWRAPQVEASALEHAKRLGAFAPGVGLPGRIWAGGRPVWVPDVARDANFPRAEAAAGGGLHGAVGFPIRDGTEFLGVMEFFSREIRQPDDALLRMMVSIGSHISQFIERRQAEKALYERLREFDVARRIQRGFSPKAAPAPAGFAVSGASRPAQETGGDCFDYLSLADGSLGLAVGDVSGHGIGAALLMATTCAYLRALTLTHTDVDRILALVNRRLVEDAAADHFVTLLLARLDPRTRSLVYSSAGHSPGYVLDGRGEVKTVLSSTGMPLGVEPAATFPSAAAVTLEPGDLVFLPSDGVIESFSADGTRFGMARALDVIRAHRNQAPGEIVEALFQAVGVYSGGIQLDDVTAVVLKVETPS